MGGAGSRYRNSKRMPGALRVTITLCVLVPHVDINPHPRCHHTTHVRACTMCVRVPHVHIRPSARHKRKVRPTRETIVSTTGWARKVGSILYSSNSFSRALDDGGADMLPDLCAAPVFVCVCVFGVYSYVLHAMRYTFPRATFVKGDDANAT